MVGALSVIWAITVSATEVERASMLNVGVAVDFPAELPQALKTRAPMATSVAIVTFCLCIFPLIENWALAAGRSGLCPENYGRKRSPMRFPKLLLRLVGYYYTKMPAALRVKSTRRPDYNIYLYEVIKSKADKSMAAFIHIP